MRNRGQDGAPWRRPSPAYQRADDRAGRVVVVAPSAQPELAQEPIERSALGRPERAKMDVGGRCGAHGPSVPRSTAGHHHDACVASVQTDPSPWRYRRAVAIRRQSRDREGIGSLKLLSALDLPTAAAGQASSVDELMRRLGGGLRTSLENPSRLHGLRAEAMFRAVLVTLGGFQLLVEEDEGQLYYDDAAGPVKQPDYRVVDAEGRHVLVEVKAVAPAARGLRHSIPASEADGLRRFGELTGAPVLVAHYWSAFNLWTLVDLDRLQPRGARHGIELPQALMFNQMGRFGDRMIGTVPPLALRLEVEELGERTRPDTATIVVRDVHLLAAGEPLTDETEKRIAFVLFRYGRWEVDTPAEIDARGRLTSFALCAAPPDDARADVERQGFAFVGALSSLYSALFNEATLDDEGAVRRLDHHSEPSELGALIPSDYFERSDRQLRLWVVRQEPADDD
jgi:hypothetical protein